MYFCVISALIVNDIAFQCADHTEFCVKFSVEFSHLRLLNVDQTKLRVIFCADLAHFCVSTKFIYEFAFLSVNRKKILR